MIVFHAFISIFHPEEKYNSVPISRGSTLNPFYTVALHVINQKITLVGCKQMTALIIQLKLAFLTPVHSIL